MYRKRIMRHLFGACIAMGLAGCAHQQIESAPEGSDAEELVAACCRTVENYPTRLVRALEAQVDNKQALSAPDRLRPAFMADKTEAHAFIRKHLQPFDLLVTSDKGILTSRVLPGYFTHSLIYLGTEAELRALGLWSHPALRPHHDALRAGKVFYESVPDFVDFADDGMVFDVDAVAVLRPTFTLAQKREGLARLMSHHRKPFDRHLNSGTDDCLYCVELLDKAFPSLGLPRGLAYGRDVIPPDAIPALALRNDAPLRFVGYVYATRSRAVSADRQAMAANIKLHWPR